MKKRTKITLRTKIYLTIVALLALTGVFYAANPSFPLPLSLEPVGVAASRTDLFASDYCLRAHRRNIDKVDCMGISRCWGRSRAFVGYCAGKIHGYRSIPVRECRVHPARRFRHTRRCDLGSGDSTNGPLTLFATISGVGCLIGPHRDYVRPCGHIWQRHDRNVRERRRL